MGDSPKLLAFLIKLDREPHGYTTVAGCSAKMLAINNHPVAFEQMAAALGALQLSPAKVMIQGHGIFTDPKGREDIERLAASGMMQKGQLYIDGGMKICGEFVVGRLEFVGCLNGEDTWDIVIESLGGCHVE